MIPERRTTIFAACIALAATTSLGTAALAAPSAESRLDDAADVLRALTDAGPESIPTELLERARGIAVIPNVLRGGFILGARRGRGVLSIRMDDGSWSNPAFITLTGGSIGWQIGAESTDIVLIFANDKAVKNIATGKFTLGGEATAVAGPLRGEASSTLTFRAEVYGYLRSRGLYAGAAFQGARLDVDEDMGERLYAADATAAPLGHQNAATPLIARRFLVTLEQAVLATPGSTPGTAPGTGPANGEAGEPAGGARTFPLPD